VLEFIKKQPVDRLLIFKWDRITRLDKEFVLLEETCEKFGVQVIAITEDYGALGPMANFSIRNSRNLAQLYSEELSFKAKLGMRRAMLEGKHSGSVIPIGYIKLAKNKAIIDSERAPFVKRTFELYSTGEYSYLSLSQKLAKEGFTMQDGKPIDNKRIEAILKQDIYTGSKTMTWKLKPYEVRYFGATKPGAFSETYKLDIEPIISKELFEKVAAIRSGRDNYE
jgi:DNA invertase Pin-like site-specific DNA recombinase